MSPLGYQIISSPWKEGVVVQPSAAGHTPLGASDVSVWVVGGLVEGEG